MAEDKGSESRSPRWKSWTRGWMWVFITILLGLFVASLISHSLVVIYLSVPGMLAIGFGAVEMLAPRRFLAWREFDTRRSGWERRALEGFDDALGFSRTVPAISRIPPFAASVSSELACSSSGF
jgi:hypothetical protein